MSILLCSSVFATENDEVYKHLGKYSYITDYGLRIYYPDSIKEAMPRIVTNFSKVRETVLANFPKEKDFVVTVILDDHDDIISSTAESRFDLINLSIFNEMNVFSARSYSLEKRFAISLAKTVVKRATSNASFAWRRYLAMLSIPHWFIEGMALNYAFPIDSIHFSRLQDMAKHGRFYSLDDLNTITSQPTLIKEEMLFQAHSMLAYWEMTYKKGADLELVSSIIRKYRGFDQSFKKYYGVSLNEAYTSYVNYVSKWVENHKESTNTDFIDVDYINNNSKIFRSYFRINENESLWVSSKRYTTENYDLYYRKENEKPRILLKNVHPVMIFDSENKNIIIGKYKINGRREKRLVLMSVDLSGKSSCIAPEAGSFKPLGIIDNRIYYIKERHGQVKIMSVNKDGDKSEKTELDFGSEIMPLDLALDCEKQTVDLQTNLAVTSLSAKNIKQDSKLLLSSEKELRFIFYSNNKLWGICDKDFSSTQLFTFDENSNKIVNYSTLPGGVWDISFSDSTKNNIDVTTFHKGGFSIASLPLPEQSEEINIVSPLKAEQDNSFLEVKGSKYGTEYHDSLWQPVLGKDSKGNVFGIYSYRSDRLDKSSIVVAPTYGQKSHDWGYISKFMNRHDLLKSTISFDDYTIQKSYMDTDYFERIKSRKLQFDYPLKLDIELSFGFDLVQRGIAKIKKSPRNLIPTAGKDHYYFLELKQKSIRTQPYNNIFPRKGREVNFMYKRGINSLFGGDMIYDSLSLKWKEFIPLDDYYVLTLNGWIAQDDKRNNIRRPDDLSLGGNEYLRAYSSSYKSGDKLRYFSFTVARPVKIQLPKQKEKKKNEFSTLGLFWEIGDTRNKGKFDYEYDRGIELASSLLLFKRLPISIKAGYAVQNGKNGHDTYCNFFMEDLVEILK